MDIRQPSAVRTSLVISVSGFKEDPFIAVESLIRVIAAAKAAWLISLKIFTVGEDSSRAENNSFMYDSKSG